MRGSQGHGDFKTKAKTLLHSYDFVENPIMPEEKDFNMKTAKYLLDENRFLYQASFVFLLTNDLSL